MVGAPHAPDNLHVQNPPSVAIKYGRFAPLGRILIKPCSAISLQCSLLGLQRWIVLTTLVLFAHERSSQPSRERIPLALEISWHSDGTHMNGVLAFYGLSTRIKQQQGTCTISVPLSTLQVPGIPRPESLCSAADPGGSVEHY